MIRRPMLAAKLDTDPQVAMRQLKALRYPVYGSVKIDGIRAHNYGGQLFSRKNKLIPNLHTQNLFKGLSHVDGELVVGDPCEPGCFHRTESGVMSILGKPDVRYFVFDITRDGYRAFFHRDVELLKKVQEEDNARVVHVDQAILNNFDELLAFEEASVERGWEGIMIRAMNGPYKQGRSTYNEGWLIKVKRFLDSEAEILSCYEQETNTNTAKINEVGLSKRSSHKAGKIKNGHLGGFIVRDLVTKVEFQVGTFDGVTKDERKLLWERAESDPNLFKGRIVKYKYFPVGVKEKPRHPILLGFRSDL